MRALWCLAVPSSGNPARRGGAGQRTRRLTERAVRRAAVAFSRWAARHGLSSRQAAAYLGISPPTLARWQRAWQQARLGRKTRGRPCRRSAPAARNRLLALLDLLGPRAGLPTLQALCLGMARREIQDLIRRYRRLWKRRHRWLVQALHWQRLGAVWAVDYAQPPLPVDGRYSRLLAVRDLATGMQLAWLPVTDESAQIAGDVLVALFRAHGPPLVLKSDNGPAFIADRMQGLLADWQVWHLLSPLDLPEYNGACEAGIGSMKTRTHHQAARYGRPAEWTSDDAEAARLEANETARPWGHRGPTPEQAWAARRRLTNRERTAFGAAAQRMEREERQKRRIGPATPLGRVTQRALNRAALTRALVALGILRFTSKRVTAPL
jgi:hypothetical protein